MTVQPSIGGPPPSRRPVPATALQLDAMVKLVDLARNDGNKVLNQLPRDTGLFQVVDLVSALNHLKQAVLLIDRVADQIEADAAEVSR